MFCRKCGNQITDGSKFCNKCGEPAHQVAAEVQPVATSTATQQTVTSMPAAQPVTITGKYCGKCGTDVALGVKFCPKCGNSMPQTNEQNVIPAASTATPANAPSPEVSVTQTENIPAVDSLPTASVVTPTAPVADAPVSAEVATATDTAASAEPLETSTDTQASETQTQAPTVKRTIRIVTPTGEITFATEESVFAGEYVLEVHRDDELLGSTKIDV